jgi:hypothetical protein
MAELDLVFDRNTTKSSIKPQKYEAASLGGSSVPDLIGGP